MVRQYYAVKYTWNVGVNKFGATSWFTNKREAERFKCQMEKSDVEQVTLKTVDYEHIAAVCAKCESENAP